TQGLVIIHQRNMNEMLLKNYPCPFYRGKINSAFRAAPVFKRYVYEEKYMKLFGILLFLLPIITYAETTSYACNYTTYSDQEGNQKVNMKFELKFIVDHETGKAYMVGNNGSNEVGFQVSDGQVAFLELTTSGNFMTTAIDSKNNSVHSRNSVMFGEMLPSQYYGKCEIK
ncbi:MAG: hypothetical protein KZQ73_02060, partial [Candidatus Thiodiazotropha sp. (ex Semelilucina semeliformis)]|nr:hypothetical protein [Candidatus Thiodiazotropha sp. (ex Semelilucina semeliformis)]